jgi:4-nitrophenyl phosphatase
MLTEKRLFLFDIDGTLALGGDLLEGAFELLEYIREIGGRSLYITNNSTKSRKSYVEKFTNWGISVTESDFVTASYATALYLKEHFSEDKLFVIGTSSFRNELREFGLHVTEKVEEGIKGVVVGYDNELTYEKISSACQILQEQDVAYIGTNPDLACPVPFGMIPDCGAICNMMEAAVLRQPVFMGKPNRVIVELCLKEAKFSKAQTVVVGDRLYTDIACGINGGVDTIAVFTGEVQEEDLRETDFVPTYTYPSVKELLEDLKGRKGL